MSFFVDKVSINHRRLQNFNLGYFVRCLSSSAFSTLSSAITGVPRVTSWIVRSEEVSFCQGTHKSQGSIHSRLTCCATIAMRCVGVFSRWTRLNRLERSLSALKFTSSRSPQMPSTPNEDRLFARFQRLVLKNFRRSWYISTETTNGDLVSLAWPSMSVTATSSKMLIDKTHIVNKCPIFLAECDIVRLLRCG
jgi:hypothetical protein